MQEIQFDFFRGMEAEQYTFYRIPKILFTAKCFRSLSCEAKVLYGLLLDRMSLSIKNRWLDEEDRVYIVFTVEEIVGLMNCGTQKAVKLLKELDADKGIGLIEKKRLGLGKPNVIYVKNFIISQTEDDGTGGKQAEEPGDMQNCENQNSGIVEITILELPKSQSNNTDINDTDISENEYSDTEMKETEPERENINPNLILSNPSIHDRGIDGIGKMEAYRDVIRENIDYKCFQDERYHRTDEVDELVELMVEVMLMPDNAVLRIAGTEKSAAVVKSRFMKLDQGHIEYILSCLAANTRKVGNIRSYLLTVLYNAALTVNNYYTAEVNHDLH